MARTGRRTDVLELAVLGVLHEAPMHGYQVRKLLNGRLGTFRALSYGTLYPTLKGLVAKGWIRESATDDAACDAPLPDAPLAGALTGRRGRIVYEITAEGKEHFQNLVTDAGPQTWRTTPSTSTSRSSPAPTPAPGCAFSRGAGCDCRSGARPPASRCSAPANAATPTPRRWPGTVSRPSSARCAGWTN